MGVDNLRNKLAVIQMDMIESNIPGIMQEIQGKKNATNLDLSKLGDDLHNDSLRRNAFNNCIHFALRKIEEALKGY